MREKIYKVLNGIYGVLMSISFFAGFLPVIPFIVAIIIGGDIGSEIAVFISKQYYPWVIILGSVAVVFGLIAMYVGKLEGLSIKSTSAEKKEKKSKKA